MAKKSWGGLSWHVVNGEPDAKVVSKEVAQVLEKIFRKKLKRI